MADSAPIDAGPAHQQGLLDMTRDFTIRWLGFMSLFVIGFGLFVASGAHPLTSGALGWATDLIFFPVDGGESLASSEGRLYAAITGGVMVGWGVMMWQLVTRLLSVEAHLVRTMLLSSAFAWYAVDSAGSLAAGAPLNVVANTVMLLAIVVPAWRIGRSPAPAVR
jgi:hypothetical protein